MSYLAPSFTLSKEIVYDEALSLNRIYSEPKSLEIFLLEKGYSFKLVLKRILWARKISRTEPLDKVKN